MALSVSRKYSINYRVINECEAVGGIISRGN
jgi:hypothetical protein